MSWYNVRFYFQGVSEHPKVAQQEIMELINLASGLLKFERRYCHTHGERTPVFRLLSMINGALADNIAVIERKFIEGDLKYAPPKGSADDIPF